MIRSQVRNFIETGGMKIGEFQKAIGVSAKSYSTFMGKNGPNAGDNTATYGAAWAFFKKRDLMGLKPLKKAKVAAPTTRGTTAAVISLSPAVSITAVTLPGEETDSIPIYDTCDEVRHKISAHLCLPSVTGAQFCRDIAAMYHLTNKKIQLKQLSDFRNKKGAHAGNTSVVYYAAYVFFEKTRVAQGKAKSKARLNMEELYKDDGGVDTSRSRVSYWCGPGETPVAYTFEV